MVVVGWSVVSGLVVGGFLNGNWHKIITANINNRMSASKFIMTCYVIIEKENL